MWQWDIPTRLQTKNKSDQTRSHLRKNKISLNRSRCDTFVNSVLYRWRLSWVCGLWASWTVAVIPAMSLVHPMRTIHCKCLVQRTSLSLSCLSNRERQHVNTPHRLQIGAFARLVFLNNLISSQFFSFLALHFGIKILTRGTNSKCCQGPAESNQVSVLWAQSFQAARHQLVQGLRQSLEILFQLKDKYYYHW